MEYKDLTHNIIGAAMEVHNRFNLKGFTITILNLDSMNTKKNRAIKKIKQNQGSDK